MNDMKVCTKCQIELKPYRNGVVAVAMATFGPMELYIADEWHCPSCEWKGIMGFSPNPFARHSDPDFASALEKLEKQGRVIYRFWLNQRERNEASGGK